MFVAHTSNLHYPYTSSDILTVTVPICILFIITFLTAGVAGSTKKFAFGCVYQLGYAVGNIIGPQTYRANDAPNYYVGTSNLLRLYCVNMIIFQTAKYTMLAFFVVTAVLIGIYGWIHHTWNQKREKEISTQPQGNQPSSIVFIIQENSLADLLLVRPSRHYGERRICRLH